MAIIEIRGLQKGHYVKVIQGPGTQEELPKWVYSKRLAWKKPPFSLSL